MKPPARLDLPRDSRGFTFVETLVAVAIFAIIVLGLGALYLSSTQAMNEGSTAMFVQRQGTQIQEELVGHTQRATGLAVDNSRSLCKPSATETAVAAGKSILYKRTVGISGSVTTPDRDEVWCLYEYQQTGDLYPQLWRCQVCNPGTPCSSSAQSLTPPQTCSTTPENVIASALHGFRGLPIGVSGTTFNCVLCTESVDVSFALDVKRSATAGSLLGGPRQFGFNITIRN